MLEGIYLELERRGVAYLAVEVLQLQCVVADGVDELVPVHLRGPVLLQPGDEGVALRGHGLDQSNGGQSNVRMDQSSIV